MNEAIIESGGIYAILNLENSRHYVGSSKGLKKRSKEHLYMLRANKHSNKILQNGWNKYGEGAFRFDVVEEVSDMTTLLDREQFWIDATLPFYNIARCARSPRSGVKMSEETKKRISESKMNPSQETRGRIAAANRSRSPEVRQRMSEAGKNRPPISEETRVKISEAGKTHSAEARAMQGLSWVGRKHTEQSLEKMRASNVGRVMSEEAKQNLREKNVGKTISEETRKKMSETHQRNRIKFLAQKALNESTNKD